MGWTLPLLVSVCACLAAGAARGDSASPDGVTPGISGFVLPKPRPLQSFELVDQHGARFTLDDLRHRWTLLLFGYTHCPDVCPTTLAQLQLVRAFSAQHRGVDLAVVFVSLDPQRDSSAQLLQYSRQFGNGFIGVGGPAPQIAAFASQLKVKYAIARGTDTGYFIDHTSSVALITPRAQLRAVLSLPLRPAAVATAIQRIVQADAAQDSKSIPGTGARE